MSENQISANCITETKTLILSSIFTEAALQKHDVASHAASEWVKGFTHGLLQIGLNVETLGHIPVRVWPLGNCIRPFDQQQLEVDVKQSIVHYWNLPFIRQYSLANSYKRSARRLFSDPNNQCHAQLVCSYNNLYWQRKTGNYLAAKGCRWIMLVLDNDEVFESGWNKYLKQTASAWGHIFVSQWAYDNAPVKRKLLMEGGFSEWSGGSSNQRSEKPSILYAGSLADYAGVEVLCDVIKLLDHADVEFWICGKGQHPLLVSLAKYDKRIKLLGFVSATELDERLRRAWVVVNPRNCKHVGASMNFPSKLLKYLSFGKAVVSMWTGGIPDEYKKICFFSNSAEEMTEKIKKVLEWSDDLHIQHSEKVRQFMIPSKTWSFQSTRFINFIRQTKHFNE